ncbi:MAG TPA: M48 family metalloprotease, partial [Rudaea sp.]
LAAWPAFAQAEVHYYLVETVAAKSTRPQTRAEAHELERIYADMEHQSGVEAKLVWSTDPDINAFATQVGSDKIVVVQEGLLETMNGDRDAVAAVLGHELGHHKADHLNAGKRKEQGARVLGAILGAVVGAKLGKGTGAVVGAAAGGVGGNLVALKFNRDQEMEADRLSVGWMIAGGYNPDGMLRLQKRLSELEGHSHAAIFSTHPTSEKRYKAAQQLIAKLKPAPELLARPAEPLVGERALAAANSEISGIQESRIAEALKPESVPPSSAALAPVNKMGFDAYAALENELQYAGAKGRAQLLAKNHLTEAQLAQMTETFSTRMRADAALAQRYNVDYFRAAQGRLAPYGRDLADSYEKGQPLRLDPPYPLDTAAQLFAQMRRRGAPNLDAAAQAKAEAEVLKPQNLTYYDFLIAHNWWARKGKIAAITGDSSILKQYYALDSDEDSSVRVGANVHTGGNVLVGGKPVATGSAAANDSDDD